MVFPLRHAGTYGGPGPPHSGPARAPLAVITRLAHALPGPAADLPPRPV